MSKNYKGRCHCGEVHYLVCGELTEAIHCNCSICELKGFLHWIVPKDQFQLQSNEEYISEYRFNTKVARHLFCKICGVHSFYIPRSHPDKISINVRCIEDIDLKKIVIKPFDGKNWEQNIHQIKDSRDE